MKFRKKIIAFFRKIFGVHSPSKEMLKQNEYYAEMLTKQLERGEEK